MDLSSHYEDLLRRAEMFSYIVDLVKSYPSDDGETDDILEGDVPSTPLSLTAREAALVLPKAVDVLPRVSVVERRIVCNGVSLDLARRPLTLRLFQAFCSAPEQQLTREQILQRVYALDVANPRSERFLDSVYGNGIKLISRTRLLAARCFGRAVSHGVEWFVFDQERKVWCLYRMRTSYLAERLR